jgi:hypothetical protein
MKRAATVRGATLSARIEPKRRMKRDSAID